MNSFVKIGLLVLLVGGGVAFRDPISDGVCQQYHKVMAAVHPPPAPLPPPPDQLKQSRMKSREHIIRFYQLELDELIHRGKGHSIDAENLRKRIAQAKQEME